jgi:hypothetical protein
MRDRVCGVMAILFFANDAYKVGLGGENEVIKLALLVGLAIATGWCVICEPRHRNESER